MRTVHATTALLVMAAASGWLALSSLPADASSVPTVQPPAVSCHYAVTNLQPGEPVTVRSAPGLTKRVVGNLRSGNQTIAGTCDNRQGWLHVTMPSGVRGWAQGHHLSKLPGQGVTAAQPGTSARTCRYTVTRVRRTSYLNVRSGAGLTHHPIAKLRPGKHAITGGCSSRSGWLHVTTPTGVRGWAWSFYLHRSSTTGATPIR
ncbi:hypothetical protein [Nonomuraea sp. NPDC049784]|uniref:SH3 domain-containing protein n=1 Tax=Nonomuraea sp. NPDC049784 TaxID=3154361 RepID=UPI0033DFDD92